MMEFSGLARAGLSLFTLFQWACICNVVLLRVSCMEELASV